MGPDLGLSSIFGGLGGPPPDRQGGPPGMGQGYPSRAMTDPPPTSGLFRAMRYALDYPAFRGKTLTPLEPPAR